MEEMNVPTIIGAPRACYRHRVSGILQVCGVANFKLFPKASRLAYNGAQKNIMIVIPQGDNWNGVMILTSNDSYMAKAECKSDQI